MYTPKDSFTGGVDIVAILMPIVFAVLLIVVFFKFVLPRLSRFKRKSPNRNASNNAGGSLLQSDEVGLLSVESLKKGRSPDQQKAIDYFFGAKKSGCLSGLLNKTGPCDDKEYDDVVLRKLNELGAKARALSKIGMVEEQVNEIDPVRVFGFEGRGNSVGNLYKAKIGDDGRWRSSVFSVTWLFFSDCQVIMYNVCFDLLSDSMSERTEDYFYSDITNFSTVTDSEDHIDVSTTTKGCFGKMQDNVNKIIVSYNSFSLIVPGDKFRCSVSGVANVTQTIQGIKQKLREKKING